MNSFGANIPEDLKWQLGKTAATIKFVNEAEKYLNDCAKSGINTSPIAALTVYIDLLKTGKEILYDWYTVSEFLMKGPKDKSPYQIENKSLKKE